MLDSQRGGNSTGSRESGDELILVTAPRVGSGPRPTVADSVADSRGGTAASVSSLAPRDGGGLRRRPDRLEDSTCATCLSGEAEQVLHAQHSAGGEDHCSKDERTGEGSQGDGAPRVQDSGPRSTVTDSVADSKAEVNATCKVDDDVAEVRLMGNLRVLCWNLQRPGPKGIATILHTLEQEKCGWDVILIQELDQALPETPVGAWEAIFTPHTVIPCIEKSWDCAVVLHQRLQVSHLRTKSCEWGCCARFESASRRFLMAAAHLPTSWKKENEDVTLKYVRACEDIKEMLRGNGCDTCSIVLGCDANVAPSTTWAAESLQAERDEATRLGAWQDLISATGLRVVPAMDKFGKAWTHEAKQADGGTKRSRIDYVATNASRERAKGRVAEELRERSDHRPLYVDIIAKVGRRRRGKIPPTLRGWRPRDVKEQQHIASSIGAAMGNCPNVEKIQQVLELKAKELLQRPRPKRSRRKPDPSISAAIAEMKRRLDYTEEWSERLRLRREIWQLRVRDRKERDEGRLVRAGLKNVTRHHTESLWNPATEEFECAEDKWPVILAEWGEEKFASNEDGDLRDKIWLAQQEAAAKCERLDGCSRQAKLTFGMFLKARWNMSTEKTPGLDGVPMALLGCLNAVTEHQILLAFEKRIQGLDCRPMQSWLHSVACGIYKMKDDIRYLKSWRWISIVAALSKWYESCLMAVLQIETGQLREEVVGFTSGKQTSDITACLATWLRKADTWQEPLYIASVDVRAAFDEMTRTATIARLRSRGASAATCAAIAREMISTQVLLRFGMCEASRPVHMGHGCRQGTASTPRLFCYDMEDAIGAVLQLWQEPAISRASGAHVPQVLCWADNFYIMSDSKEKLEMRMRDLDLVFADRGFALSTAEVLVGKWARPSGTWAPLLHSDVELKGTLPCLGVALDSTAETLTMISHRAKACERLWSRHGSLLCHGRAETEVKLRALYRTLGACFLHGAAIWRLDKRSADAIKMKEARWLRQCIGYPIGGQAWIDWWCEMNRYVDAARRVYSMPSLLQAALALQWGYTGHAIRAGTWAAGAWQWRSPQWWREQQECHSLGAGLRHPRRGWRRSPEEFIDEFLPYEEWQLAASDRWQWKMRRASFIEWGNEKLKGHEMPYDWHEESCWSTAMSNLRPWRNLDAWAGH